MLLPISYEDAVAEWDRFENYLVRERYAVRDPRTGKPIEADLGRVLHRVSREFSCPGVTEAILQGRIMPATPFLMNGGNPYTRRQGYYSCYPLGVVEDSTDAIFNMERDLVTIFQHSGGGGIDISRLRPKGAPVDNGQGTASGPVSFAKGFSNLSARISQGGKRRGALMIQADWDVADIREIITFKGDNPGLYTGCNVSINVTDERFWADQELIQLIAAYIWRSGDPGLLFIGKSLANTPVPREYEPIYSNPCGEYLSSKDTACNLLTICLPRLLREDFNAYLTGVYETARLAAMAGNEILDLGGFPPVARIRENTLKFRPVGIGFTGLQHAMNYYGVSYADEQDAPLFTKATQFTLMLGTMQGSLDYAAGRAKQGEILEVRVWDRDYVEKSRQAALAFAKNELRSPGGISRGGPGLDAWLKVAERLFATLRKLGGLYNSVTTTQPPTGSTSQLLRVACTGIEPYYSMMQTRRVKDVNGSWQEFTLVPLEFYGYDAERLDWVAGQTAHKISPRQQIRIMEAGQTFNHTSVSKTINLPAATTVDEIREMLNIARASNLKGITMFRDTSMGGVLTEAGTPEPESAFADLPERLGSTFKFKGPASLYVTANKGAQDHLREVFLNTTKSGSTIHGMCEALGRVISVALQHDYRLVGKIARTLEDISSDAVWQSSSLGRVYSIPAAVARVLQHYAATAEEEELPPFRAAASAYVSCPTCGKLTFRRTGGCSQCVNCGFSTC